MLHKIQLFIGILVRAGAKMIAALERLKGFGKRAVFYLTQVRQKGWDDGSDLGG